MVVFGPVPSRRLGQSLGIDTIPLKTCNWNCVYCQLGRTRPLTNTRREYYPRKTILDEARETLAKYTPTEIDWVTFVGSGEPTLHVGIGDLIRQIKAITSTPVAVITNGSLLYQPTVRHELVAADAVLPTLDAGTPELYQRINRPHPDITFDRLVEGLMNFRHEYNGRLWIEVMLVQGVNDSASALQALADILRRIAPDEIHISLPTRPPAEPWVSPPEQEAIMRAMVLLGEVTSIVQPATGSFDLREGQNPVDAVIDIITRHPMRQEELEQTLNRCLPDEMENVLTELEQSGRAQLVERYGIRFWSASPAYYPPKKKNVK